MTLKRPEKKTLMHDNDECSICDVFSDYVPCEINDEGFNQSHAEWSAYTDQLLKPLEDMLKKYTRINYHSYLGISATEILNEVQKVIDNHKGEAL